MDNLIGKTLDGLYTIRELIGTGGMANVYKAVVTAPGGPVPEGTVVAVKVLRQELMHDADLVRRFKNESKAISLLNHPNIVKVYDVSVSENLQYIVMECVEGMTLREYLNERGGKITSRETVHFIGQILRALDHAHRNGVVHRDIKPQNIMLLDNGQLRMMDFGIARISRAENQIQNGRKAMGSVHYISPEQARGDETDPKSDLYSVGVMMYEMLSGKLPFDADDMVEVARKQITDDPKPLAELAPEVPLGLVQITERAMAKLPVNRYASAAEMLEALDAYVRDPSITFDYQYVKEKVPEKAVNEPMAEKRTIRRPPEAQKTRTKAKKKKPGAFMPVLLGITAAFALACAALCWVILSDSSNIMNKKADIVLSDFSGMTQDEVNASPQVASGQVVVDWEQEYSNDYAAGHVYKQSPVAGRTVREGQSVTLTVSLGVHYVTVPDLTNYVQADGEQQLKELGVSVLVTQAVDESVAAGSIIRTQSGSRRHHRRHLRQPPAGGHHHQGAQPHRHERERRPYPAGAEEAGPRRPDRAVQRPARGHHHQPVARRGRIGQAQHPRQRGGQRRAGACTGTGSTQRERQQLRQLRRRLVERPVRQRQLVLVQHCRQREQQRLLREHRRRPRRLVDVVAGVRERL